MNYCRRAAKAVLIVAALVSTIPASGQNPKDKGTDILLHKLQPKVAPESLVQEATANSQFVNGMSTTACRFHSDHQL
jgi:hypothetical protein